MTVNFPRTAWLLRRIAYNKDRNVRTQRFHLQKWEIPQGVATSPGDFLIVTVNFLCTAWLLRRMAYNKSTKERKILPIVLTKAEENPLLECQLQKGVFLFSAYGPWTIRQATCKCNTMLHLLRQTAQKKEYFPFFSPPLPNKMGGQGRKTIITYNSPKRYRKRQEKSDCKLSAHRLTFTENRI